MIYEIGAATPRKSYAVMAELKNTPKGLTAFVHCINPSTGKILKTFSLTADVREIHNRVMEYLSTNAPVGWGWNPIKKLAKNITKKVGAKRLLRTVNKVVNDPRFKKGMMLASTVYPPLGITYGQMQSSAKLLQEVKSGVEDSVDRFSQLVQLARNNDPKALRVVAAMRAMVDASAGDVAKVSGLVEKVIQRRFGFTVRQYGSDSGPSAYQLGLRA